MKLLISLILIYFVSSCSSDPKVNQIQTGPSMEGIYISSGIEKFFLGSIPHWMNFSSWAMCSRKEPIRYMHYDNLNKSYGLNYAQMIHIQHMWNRKIYAYRNSTQRQKLPLKEESNIFNNVYAKVNGGSYDFVAPKFSKVSLIWIDTFLKNKKKLKKVISSDRVLAGHPVILSHCLNSFEIEALMQELKLDEYGAKFISAEMFSVYDSKLKKTFKFTIDVSALLKNKEITLFGQKDPETVFGINKFIKVD